MLLDAADAHPGVVSAGQLVGLSGPVVRFVNFGESSLDFELRMQILEADQAGTVSSDLRFAIDAAFREAGIEMPFPQRDLNRSEERRAGTACVSTCRSRCSTYP